MQLINRLIILIPALSLCCHAQNSEQMQTTTETAATGVSQQLADHYDTNMIRLLDESTTDSFFVQVLSRHKITYGNLLFVSPAGIPPLQKNRTDYIAQQLADMGWNSFHLYIPLATPNLLSAENSVSSSVSTTNTPSNATDSETPLEATATQYKQHTSIIKAANLITSEYNDELFAISFHGAADILLNTPADQFSVFTGIVYVAPEITNTEVFTNTIQVASPTLVLASENKLSTQSLNQWITAYPQTQRSNLIVVRQPRVITRSPGAKNLIFRLHGWLKKLVLENKN